MPVTPVVEILAECVVVVGIDVDVCDSTRRLRPLVQPAVNDGHIVAPPDEALDERNSGRPGSSYHQRARHGADATHARAGGARYAQGNPSATAVSAAFVSAPQSAPATPEAKAARAVSPRAAAAA